MHTCVHCGHDITCRCLLGSTGGNAVLVCSSRCPPLLYPPPPSGQRLGHVGAVPASIGQQATGEEEGSRARRGRGRRGRVRRRPRAHDRPASLALPL